MVSLQKILGAISTPIELWYGWVFDPVFLHLPFYSDRPPLNYGTTVWSRAPSNHRKDQRHSAGVKSMSTSLLVWGKRGICIHCKYLAS